jgi:hypothetical protein
LIFGGVLVDTLSSRSAVRRGAESYLVGRLTEELGIGPGKGDPTEIARVVDRMVGGLPAPPRAWKVLRPSDVAALAISPGGTVPGGGDPDPGPYALRLRDLLHDVRIFAASNVALLLLTGLLAIGRQPAVVPCLIPAGLLGIATLTSIVLYIGARDWFWSFLDDDYAGIGYLSLVGVIVAFLVDIVLNRARVTGLLLRLLYWVPI